MVLNVNFELYYMVPSAQMVLRDCSEGFGDVLDRYDEVSSMISVIIWIL